MQQIIFKPMDDFQLLIKTRVNEHKEAEAARIKAEAERMAKAEAERMAAEQQKKAETVEPVATTMQQPSVETEPEAAVPPTINDDDHIKLGDICARLGFTVTAAFLESIGILPAGKDRTSVLYRDGEFPAICHALITHIQAITTKEAQ